MATCRDTIRRALQRLQQLQEGEEPEATEANDALVTLQGLYNDLIVRGAFGRLKPVVVTSSPYTAKEGERIVYTGDGALSLTLPATLAAWEPACAPPPLTGSRRAPLDLSLVVLAGSPPRRALYDADQAAWVDLYGLALTTEAPLTDRFDGLVDMLALRLSAEDGAPIPTFVAEGARVAKAAIARAFSEARQSRKSVYF